MNTPEQEIQRAPIDIPEDGRELPLGMLKEKKEKFLQIRTIIAGIFRNLGEFVHGTFSEIRSFNTMIKPYALYFYAGADRGSGVCFIKDVIEPSRDEMLHAVIKAVEIMHEDETIYATIAESIEKTLAFRENIDDILNIIGEIEIYFLNALIVSIKAGSAGQTLTRLSREIGGLSETTTAISAGYNDLIDRLDGEYSLFKSTRDNITVIQENYLTRISLSIRSVFSDITENVRTLSDGAGYVLHDSHNIENVMVKVLGWLQREDIFCQDVDKLVFLMDLCISGEAGSENFGAVFNRMFHDKSSSLQGDMESVSREFRELIALIKNLSTGILYRVGESPGTAGQGDDTESLDGIYLTIEKMKNTFIEIIEAIIENKKKIHMLSSNIRTLAGQFGEFFTAINRIIRKFEIINLLTRIEIARNNAITLSLGGSLFEISKLPGRIKSRVSRAEEEYAGIMDSIGNTLNDFYTTMINQESLLGGIIESIKKVSVKLNESKKYYYDISMEIEKSAAGILQFVGDETTMLSTLAETVERVRCIGNGFDSSCTGADAGQGPEFQISAIRLLGKRFTESIADGDYRKCMLESFFNEYLDDEKDRETVFF